MGDMSGMNHAGMHDMSAMDMGAAEFGGVPESRDASGTSWQPDETPMHAHHRRVDDWTLMLHYNAFLSYERQSGPRGDHQFNSVNWLMAMASKETEVDEWMLRTMLSLEPWTVTNRGYPLLFQSGEAYRGHPLVDLQHPHDFFMEVATRYRRILQPGTVISLYAAPSGEPALGPTAFPHRLSGMDNPAAPISHHWLDSTHIAFGVLTLGVAQRAWRLEGSWFNGREPDEHRWNFDPIRLNSYSARLSWNPAPEWSAQISGGYLKSPEELHPDENLHRYTASLSHGYKMGENSHLATSLGWGVNVAGGHSSNAMFAESAWSQRGLTVFGRIETVEKTGEELDLAPEHAKWTVTQISLGASQSVTPGRPYDMAVGATATYSLAPQTLRSIYGEHPIGWWLFVRVRPAGMARSH